MAFCGIGRVPKGKTRGTPEQCLSANQVRYYGLVAIDESLLNKGKKKVDPNKERAKLQKLFFDQKVLLRELQKVDIILGSDTATKTEKKNAAKKQKTLKEKRKKLVEKFNAQRAKVIQMDKEEQEAKMQKNKVSAKTAGGTGKKSDKKSKNVKKPKKSTAKKTDTKKKSAAKKKTAPKKKAAKKTNKKK